MRGCGLTGKLCRGKPVLGYTDTETVKLDFDDTSFRTVMYWANRAMRWFKLGGYVVLKSSKKSYHVVFDRAVSWSENLRVVAWVSLQSQNRGLIKWLIMQCIKQSSTLRVSMKNKKHPPRVVFRHGEQEGQIQDFLEYRKLIKRLIKKTDQQRKRHNE